MYARHGALVKHQHQIEGINSRLDGLQAAILNVKLKYIHEWTKKRIENANYYTKKLSNIAGITTPLIRPDSVHTFHLYVILAKDRNKLAQFLQIKGIETAIHYPTILPSLPCYSYLNLDIKDFSVAHSLQDSILSLPIFPELEFGQIDYIASVIEEFYRNNTI